MAMTWNVIEWKIVGGDPAPGEPSIILNRGVVECLRVSEVARSARNELERIKDEFTSAIWAGEAAQEFSKSLPTVLDDLRMLDNGYSRVADALKTYASELTDLQDEARSTLNRAQVAASDISSLDGQLSSQTQFSNQLRNECDQIENQVRALERAVIALTKQKMSLQSRRAQTSDPAAVAALDLSINRTVQDLGAAEYRHRQQLAILISTERNLDEARSEIRDISQRLSGANERLQGARTFAGQIGNQHAATSKRTATAIRDAKGTAVGTTWEKKVHEFKKIPAVKAILENIDSISKVLGYTIFALHGIAVLTVKAGILGVAGVIAAKAAVVLGIVAIAIGAALLIRDISTGSTSLSENLLNAGKLALSIATKSIGGHLTPIGKLLLSGVSPAMSATKRLRQTVDGENWTTTSLRIGNKAASNASRNLKKAVRNRIEDGKEFLEAGGNLVTKVVTSSVRWKMPKLIW